MAAPAPRVLLLDAGGYLEGLARQLAGQCIPVEHRDTQPEEGSPDATHAVVVIAPSVPHRAAVARRLRATGAPLHFIFVAAERELDAVRQGLLFAAPAGTPWSVSRADDPAIERTIVEALELGRRALQTRTTLDRLNLQLATAEPPDPSQYRRLLASDQYLASILRSAPDAIVSVTPAGVVLSWNEGASRMLGVPPSQAVGAPIASLARWSGDIGALLEAAMHERFVRTELRVGAPGGELLLDALFSSIEHEGSQVTAVAVMMRDITARKRTEEALARSEMQFRALADNITQLTWMTHADGSIFWYNRRWFEYTGTTIEQMRGWGWRDVHHPDHIERVVAKFKAHIEAQVPWEDTFPLRSRDGDYRWFLSRAVPIRDAAGRVVNWFGTNTDITAERDAQQALKEADQRKNEFISVLSHELRNPLAPIRNSVFLLEKAAGNEPVARRAREVISRQTEHLARLVDDLLDVTRIARGKIELVTRHADLAAVVRGTVEDFADVARSAGLSLSFDAPKAPIHADVDVARIAQVLGNLLHNAVKFTPAGGRIDVRMALEDGTAQIAVSDSGSGIEPELLPRLGEPFVQGERTLARSLGGLGLGLSLARGIVEMHGGRLSIASGGRDRGATFTVWLPADLAVKEASRDGAALKASTTHRSRQVLVVDDNRDAADSLAQLVRLFGHEADVAYDGPTAILRARQTHPDVILCDIGLPGMDGYEVARRVRDEMADIRVFAVSGYAQPTDLAAAAQAGFAGHVAKPPRPEEIRRIIQA